MYLSIVRLWNFRKYSSGENNAPGLEIHFHKGVNVLIGENDSGKTIMNKHIISRKIAQIRNRYILIRGILECS